MERRCWKETISWVRHVFVSLDGFQGYGSEKGSINLISLWKDFVCRRGRLTGWDNHVFCFNCVATAARVPFVVAESDVRHLSLLVVEVWITPLLGNKVWVLQKILPVRLHVSELTLACSALRVVVCYFSTHHRSLRVPPQCHPFKKGVINKHEP